MEYQKVEAGEGDGDYHEEDYEDAECDLTAAARDFCGGQGCCGWGSFCGCAGGRVG